MAQYVFELDEVTDPVTEWNGNSVDTTAAGIAADPGNNASIDDHGSIAMYHPDLIVEASSAPTAIINGIPVTAELIAGSHPPRPR